MKLFNKAPKDEQEPQYYISPTNVTVLNYKVYYMKPIEKLLYRLLAFAVGAAVGYLFYGGIGKNEFGDSTAVTYICNILSCVCVGSVAAHFFIPIRTEQILKRRKKKLTVQFKDMLDTLTTSLGSGKNVPDSFAAAYEDLMVQYDEDSYIVQELQVIMAGISNNIAIEEMLMDFGRRSGIDDIVSFSKVFQISYRKGGNMKDIIRNTHSILSDKMQISEEIETLVTSNKNEQNVMNVMPIMLIGVIKLMSPEFSANFTTATGIMSTTIAIVCFVVAYIVSKKLLSIDV